MSKVGRPLLIPDPETMWKHFTNYKKWVEENPILVEDYVGKDGDRVLRQKNRALTFEGFCNFLQGEDIMSDPTHYFTNYENRYTKFLTICSRIKREIRQHQIEGGLAGVYNPSITQRLNGLVEKVQEDGTKEVTIKVKYGRKGDNSERAASESIQDS